MLALATLVLAVVSCAPAAQPVPDVDVELTFEPAPFVGPTSCRVRLTDLEGQLVAATRVELEGNMDHAGMLPVFAQAEELASGEYVALLEFTMGGDWFILVRAQLEDGRSGEWVVELPGVGSPGDAPGSACCSTGQEPE